MGEVVHVHPDVLKAVAEEYPEAVAKPERPKRKAIDRRSPASGVTIKPGTIENRRHRRRHEKLTRGKRAEGAAKRYQQLIEEETAKIRARLEAGESVEDIRADLKARR